MPTKKFFNLVQQTSPTFGSGDVIDLSTTPTLMQSGDINPGSGVFT